jgi:hypothetical protein
LPRFYSIGAIAQLVEHRTENPGVPGSIPGGTTAKPRKPLLIFGSVGAFQFMLTGVLMDFNSYVSYGKMIDYMSMQCQKKYGPILILTI